MLRLTKRLFTNVMCKEIPSFPVWTKLYFSHRSLATPRTFHNKVTPDIISPWMIRWSLISNDFKLVHRPGKVIANAAAPSRVPCPPLNNSTERICARSHGSIISLRLTFPSPPLVTWEVAQFTRCDPELPRVYSWVERGWPQKSKPKNWAY